MSIRSALRAATSVEHAMLEETRLMKALTSGVPSDDDYLGYLWRQWDLHAALEPALGPWLPPRWIDERLIKRHWLERDLAALLHTTCWDVEPAPITLTPVTSVAEALGSLYVLEGSTLGLRMIQGRLPPGHPGLGAAGRFIQGYEADHGLYWRQFLERLEMLPAEDWAAAIAAARATFQAFLTHFSTGAAIQVELPA